MVRNGCDAVTARARVPRRRKAELLLASLAAACRSAPDEAAPPLPATSELVAGSAAAAPRLRRPGFEDRLVWLVTLFGELDGRQAGRS